MKKRKDETEEEFLTRRLDSAQITIEQHTTEKRKLQRRVKDAEQETADLRATMETLGTIPTSNLKVPKWTAKAPKSRTSHVARPVLMLSDLHLDEVVDPYTMDGLNEFNREIAEARFERTIQKTVEFLRRYTAGMDFDGITVMLGGDIVTGTIHEELAETNAAPLPDTIQFWTIRLASALTYLADEMGRVHVACVDGNHDRSGKRMKYKNRAMESWAWTMYKLMAHLVREDDRIDVTISPSSELIVPTFDTKFLLLHGDGAKGGNGIGGISVPISRYVHKLQMTYAATSRPFDMAVMGHWHQLIYNPSFVVNGSLKGYDEYAKGHGFKFERPQQALFLVTPERGITMNTAIHAE